MGQTEEEAERLTKKGPDSRQLPNVVFPPQISVTASPKKALAGVAAVLLVVPSQTMRQNLLAIKCHVSDTMLIINASKGLEYGSNKRMSQIIAEELPAACHHNICVLSAQSA